MKKLDSKELTADFNSVAQKHKGETFLAEDLNKLLEKYFNRSLIYAMKRANLFMVVQTGTNKLYQFKEEPLYFQKMDKILSDWRDKVHNKKQSSVGEEPVLDERERAIALLKREGIVMKKCVGFNEQLFAKENPELYQRYLIYEEI